MAGAVCVRLGDVSRQRERFSEALRWYAKSGASLDARCGRAMALRGLGRYGEAIRLFHDLRAAYQGRRDREGEAYALWAAGTTERFAGRLSAAESHLREAVRLYRKVGDARGLAYARCGLGGALRMMGRAAESLGHYAAAHKVFRRWNDRFGMSYASCGQGNAWRMQGRVDRALPFMNAAIAGYRRLDLKGPMGFVFWSRAQAEIARNRPRAAREDLRRAERCFRAVRDPRGIVYVDLGWGELDRASGESGRVPYERARRRARRLGLPFEFLHAASRLDPRKQRGYKRLGIDPVYFPRYAFLP